VKAFWRRNRVGLLLGGALTLALLLLALVVGGGTRGALDPDGYDPDGAHALAVLLRDNGVPVERTTDVPGTLAQATGATVFVPEPQLLSEEELQLLADGPGRLVVAQADPGTLDALGNTAVLADVNETRNRDPGCDLGYATNAGRALTGGPAYRSEDAGARSCYAASLLEVPGAHLVLLGDPSALTNDHLDEQGNAALGIGLLGASDRVVWLMPSPDRQAIGAKPLRSPDDLLPDWVVDARRGLVLGLVVLALWRGRRLGRVVLEQLPVVVRAAETVEGHGRLYQAAGARGTAAEALRRAALRTLARLSHGGEPPGPEALTALVAERAGREGSAVRDLLYGPPPADDAALVRLASELDRLTHDALTR
jgi:hypothetical protein